MTRETGNRCLGLEYLSVFGMPLRDYVALAGRIGCDFVSVNYGGASNRLGDGPEERLRDDPALRRDLAAAVADQGLFLGLVEGFAITPGTSIEDHAADLDAVARMEARSICAVSLDKDRERTADQFARLAELAAARGLLVTTEVGAGVMRNFAVACEAWSHVAQPNFTLLVDTMHFFRRGGTVSDLAAVPAGAIGHVQLCDVPMPAHMENYLEEALFERRAPGDGDLPLAAFVAAVPPAVSIGLEVPIRSEAMAGVPAEARLARCMAAARSLCARTGRA